MSDVKARAEARRKAILSRGGDRLTKLTSSARGEDYTILDDDPPLPVIPSASSPSLHAGTSRIEDTFALHIPPTHEHQSQSGSDPFSIPTEFGDLQALLSSQTGGFGPQDGIPTAPTNIVKKEGRPWLLLLLHLISTVGLVIYFSLVIEKGRFDGVQLGDTPESFWTSWADLLRFRDARVQAQTMKFLWAFTSVQAGIQAFQLLTGTHVSPPPFWLGMVMPMLPPTVGTAISSGISYYRLGSSVVDDVAIAVFTVGAIVWCLDFMG